MSNERVDFQIEVVHYSTGKVVKEIGQGSERSLQRMERGVNINLNHNDYFTRVSPVGKVVDGKLLKLKKDMVFVDNESNGSAWRNLCNAENDLAEKLLPYPLGTFVAQDGEAWFLAKSDDTTLVLTHANYHLGVLSEPTNRFEFDLSFVDQEEESLENAMDAAVRVLQEFVPEFSETCREFAEKAYCAS